VPVPRQPKPRLGAGIGYAGTMNGMIQLLYQARRALIGLLRLRTRGVKVMVFNDKGELLLIRNSYGNRRDFVLPGGGIRPFETPAAAALREVHEEAGIAAERVTPLSVHHSRAEGKRDTIHLFSAWTTEAPTADGIEVEEARFFPLDALPDSVSAATLRRIGEFRGERPIEAAW
jgi:8-oxo-dGTP pyrophosphatase MutT (NUDIX family)